MCQSLLARCCTQQIAHQAAVLFEMMRQYNYIVYLLEKGMELMWIQRGHRMRDMCSSILDTNPSLECLEL
jgi:hypothetical protein